mgnify:CR=1 FL=1
MFGSRTRAKFEYAYRDLGTRQGQYRPRSLPHQPKNQICQSSKKFQFPFNNYQGVNARFLIYHATTWDINCRRYKVFSFFRQYGKQKVLVAVNLSNQVQTVSFDANIKKAKALDAKTPKYTEQLSIAPFQFMVWEVE